MRQEIKLSWSNKENDWMFNYPDVAGKTMMGIFFAMIKIEENVRFLQPSELNKEIPKDIKTMLAERGYDYTTLKITVKKL